MTDAERRRRYQAYALQQGINKPLRVEEPQTKPSVSVQPAQPTRFKVRVSPNVEVKPTARVTSPFMQPTAPAQDTRAWGTKLFDTVNPVDNGRSWATPGQQSSPNWAQRNLSPTGVFNFVKEAAQGTARLPIEIGQTVEQQYRVVQETEKLKKQGLTDEQAAKEVESRIKSKTWRPTGWQKRLFGDKAESYQAQAQEISQLIEAETGKKPSPAAVTAGLVLTSGPMGGTGKYRKPFVKALTKSKDVDEIVELAAKEGIELTKDNATLIAMSEKPNDIVNLLDNAVDTGDVAEAVVDGVPKAANATSTISDEVVTQVTKSKSATEVKEAVQALFPTLAPKEVDDISVQLAKSKDIDEVRSVLEEARIRSDQVSQTVDAAVPEGQPVTQAAKQEQELAQAVQDGTAPQTVTQAPEQPITTETATQAPKSIEGATDVTDIPNVSKGAPIEKTAPFDTETEIPQINRILKNEDTVAGGEKIADYYRNAKGEDWRVVNMTPDEYLDRAARAMGENPETWRNFPTGDVKKYAADMKKGDKFPMPWVNEVAGTQEGRSRALAAKLNGEKTIPVAVAEKYDPVRFAERQKDADLIAHNEKMLRILNGEQAAEAPKPVVKPTAPPKPKVTVKKTVEPPKIETSVSDVPPVAPDPQPTNINDIDLQTTAQKIAKRTGRAYNAVLEELYDPYLVAQRLDDDLAKQVGISKSDANLALASRQITKKLSDETDATEFANETFTRPLSNGESMSNVFNRNPDIETKNGLYNPFIEYLHNRFFLEIYEKSDGKIWKSQNFTPEQVKDRIAQFEAQNPSAQTDAMLAREWKDVLVDEGVRFGQISEEIGNDLRKYENFVPLERAVDEDFVRPTVSGGVGSVGRNNVAQVLTEQAGNYDQSLESLMQRAAKVFGQTRKNATNIELFNRIKEGSLKAEDGWVVYVDPAKTKARRELVAKMEATRATLESARKGRNKLATKKSLTKKDVKQAETEAAETARQYYISQAVDDAGVSFARKLSRQELLEVFDVLVEASEINAKRTINKLSKKGGEYKRLSEQLQLARDEVRAIKAELSGDWKTAQALYEKAPAGENKVAGFINGEKFVIGVSDDYARMRNKIEKSKNDTVAQISGAIATPQKVVATGLGNPVFLAKDVVRRQGVKLTNSQGLSPFGARPLASWFAGLTSPQQSAVFANLRDAGFIPEKATKVGYTVGDKAQDIASRADYGSRIAYLAKNPGKLWNSFNKFAAKLGNADRVQIGYGAYLRAKRLYPELTDAQAWEAGAKAANEALGNFRRTSLTARRLEAVAPYTTATQAGYRSLMRRFREAPVETSLKVGGILGALVGVTAYNAEQYLDYYDQKIESGNTNDLDNNIIFILPGAHLNEETGEWEGIVKIPVAPDFRPLVRGSWRAAYDRAKTGQVNVKNLAKEFTNFMSADQGGNVYTQKGGFLPQSPVKKGIQIEQGIDPYTGKPLVTDEYMATKPKTEQFDKYSSDFAKSMSVRFNGALSPKEVDAWLNQMGYFADIIQGYSDKGVGGAVVKPFKNIFVGSKGFTEKQRQATAYGEDVQAVSKTFDDAKQFRIWQSQFRTGRTDSKGVKVGSAQLDSAEKALALFNNQEVLEAEMDMNARQSERTGNSNPLLDDTLTPQQRDAVLMYRSMKAPNAAKQNYTKGGESAFVSLGLDEKWYEDFKAKENAYWDKVIGESDGGVKTFSGKEKPQATPELQKKLDYYYTLPKGTGDRSSFLNANQDVIDYWNAQNDFTNEERAALGFKPLAKEDSTTSGFRIGGSATKKANLDELIRQIDTGITPTKIRDLAPKKTKFKVKLPSSSNGRSYKRIRLQ